MNVLAVETSCDETSVAIVRDGKEVLANVVLTQIDKHKLFGGVVPEVASRMHIETISVIFEEALLKAKLKAEEIDLVAVTKGPGLIGALLVGINAAKAFALAHNLPFVGINHLSGHIYANNIENDLKFPLIALLVSGGHTELVYMKDHHDYEILGETLDDAVGEAYDKIGRVLGLPYPAGPYVDAAASKGVAQYSFPRAYLDKERFDFSFSGLKSAVINFIHNKKQRDEVINVNDICASFQESVIEVLVNKTKKAKDKYQVKQVIVAGGVAANKGLKKAMLENIDCEVSIPSIRYCTDNAAMIAASAYFLYQKNKHTDDFSLNGMDSLRLDEE